MKKTLTWITWLSLSAVSPFALAVGLGQASVSSYLNAPLDASVPLLESGDYALDAIRVGVAEPSDFVAAGLEWTPLAAGVRAEVVERQGQRQVRLMSEQTMQEPWLDILLTVDFPGGEQFSAITLLFDPQDYSQHQPLAQNPGPRPQASTTSTSSTAMPAAAQPTSSPSAYVGSGDTLWSVAERVKPSQASVQQAMVALLEANPEAFPSGNINDIRANQTLRVPAPERILARSAVDTDAAIQAMNDAWRAGRNGSLQAVLLPDVEVDPMAVAASQRLAVNRHDEPETGESIASDPAAVEAETDEPDALTRAELTEQLRLSQATLQQVLEERALMRAELDELRGDVASLTQSLSDALAAQRATPEPQIATMDAAGRPGVVALVERYQWPLVLAAIALLLALLVWLRKRREEHWEGVPSVEPVVTPPVSTSVPPKAAPMSEAVSAAYPRHAHSDGADEPRAENSHPAPLHGERAAEPEPHVDGVDTVVANTLERDTAAPLTSDDGWVEGLGVVKEQAYSPSYENSQAAGLVGQGSQRRTALHIVPGQANVSLTRPPSSAAVTQWLAGFAGAESAAENSQPSKREPAASTNVQHRFIDYHPPMLNSAPSGRSLRTETLMQPTVEFSSQSPAEPLAPAPPRRPMEEEWDIEEVAFKPRGLDNSEPSKSSK